MRINLFLNLKELFFYFDVVNGGDKKLFGYIMEVIWNLVILRKIVL